MSANLDSSYARWRDEPFPPGSPRDEVDQLHAELATVDLWIADMVVPFVEHGTQFPLKVDIEGGIRRLRDRVLSLHDAAAGEERDLLERYLNYIARLDEVFRAYQATTSAST